MVRRLRSTCEGPVSRLGWPDRDGNSELRAGQERIAPHLPRGEVGEADVGLQHAEILESRYKCARMNQRHRLGELRRGEERTDMTTASRRTRRV